MAIFRAAKQNMYIGSCKFKFAYVSFFIESRKNDFFDFSGNIPNGDVSKGELIVPYLQPFPPRGTGYHRHVFVLYKQDQNLNFDELKVQQR